MVDSCNLLHAGRPRHGTNLFVPLWGGRHGWGESYSTPVAHVSVKTRTSQIHRGSSRGIIGPSRSILLLSSLFLHIAPSPASFFLSPVPADGRVLLFLAPLRCSPSPDFFRRLFNSAHADLNRGGRHLLGRTWRLQVLHFFVRPP